MKYNLFNIDGDIVKNDEYGIVRKNDHLNNFLLYSYLLYRNKSTKRFNFEKHDCIYVFVGGKGVFELEKEIIYVNHNDVILVPKNTFHKVINTGDINMNFLMLKEKIKNEI